jgi:hypothetical protein
METPELEAIDSDDIEAFETGGETDSVSPTESPPQDREEFERRVNRLVEMMQEDPAIRDRILAETYVNIASAEIGIRGVFEAIQQGGMAGLMKGAFRRGG